MAKVDHKPTQNQRILEYIERYGSIDALQGIKDLGIMRLASRVSDLRREGYPIVGTNVPVKNRFGEKTYIKRYSFEVEHGRG